MVLSARVAACVSLDDVRNTPGMCLEQVRFWYDIGPLYPNAAAAWRHASDRHEGDRNPPRGAAVFWTGGSRGLGHVAISLGDGRIRSTDARGRGLVGTVGLWWPESAWGLKYAGWAWSLNGVTIPHPRRAT